MQIGIERLGLLNVEVFIIIIRESFQKQNLLPNE